MARELDINIRVNTDDAHQQLSNVDDALDRSGRKAHDAGDEFEKMGAAIGNVAKDLVGSLGVYLSVRGVLGAIEKSTEYANTLQRMAITTGLSTDAIQELTYASKLSGVSIDTVTTSISRMERRLAEGGDAGAIAAVRKLGFSIEQIRQTGPKAFFELGSAIEKIPDQLTKTRTEAEIFGGQAAGHLQPIIENLNEIREKAHDVGVVLSNDQVKALGDLSNLWDTAKLKAEAYFATIVAGAANGAQGKGLGGSESDTSMGFQLLGALGGAVSGARLGASVGGGYGAVAGGVLGGVAGLAGGQGLEGLRERFFPNADELDAMGHSADGQAPKGPALFNQQPLRPGASFDDPDNREHNQRLAALDAIAKTLTAETRERIALEKEADALQKQMFTERMHVNKEITAEIKKQIELMAKAQADVVQQNLGARERNNAAIGRDINGNPIREDLEPFKQYDRDTSAINIARGQAPGADVSQMEAERDRKFNESMMKAAQSGDALFHANTDAANSSEQLSKSHAGAVVAADAATQAFMRFSGVNVSTAGGATDLRHKSMIDTIVGGGMYTENEASALAAGIFVNSTAGRQRAAGGPVSAGEPYLVGERGPELFTPGQSGGITPNGAGGGVAVGDIHIHGNVDSEQSARALADQVAERVMRKFKQSSRVPLGKN